MLNQRYHRWKKKKKNGVGMEMGRWRPIRTKEDFLQKKKKKSYERDV